MSVNFKRKFEYSKTYNEEKAAFAYPKKGEDLTPKNKFVHKFSKPNKFKNKSEDSDSDTSWQKVSKWYGEKVGDKGQYFHQQVIIPKALELLNLKPSDSVLDLACGEGVFARNISPKNRYLGIDLSTNLIHQAQTKNRVDGHIFESGDVSKPFNADISKLAKEKKFTAGIIMLALQNIEDHDGVFKNFSEMISKDGKILIILNHPYFRIPRLTAWGIDEGNKKQFRKVYGYMNSTKIPINMTPGQGKETVTWTFHVPLQEYIRTLNKNGFSVELIEEWVSDKTSVGKASKMENLARSEFPMFMGILARKN